MRREEMACSRCGALIGGDCVMSGSLMFCSERCERESSSDAVDTASRDSFPASDPPSRGSPAISAASRMVASMRDEDGQVGWALLWLLGVPIPVLMFLFLLRGSA